MIKQKVSFKRVFGLTAVIVSLGTMWYPTLSVKPAPMAYAGAYGPQAMDCMTDMEGINVNSEDMLMDSEPAPQAI